MDKVWENFLKDREQGFSDLYESYYEQLLMYCLGKLRHLDLAENAVSDIFIKVFKFKNPETIENPEGWIFTLAKNHCLSHWNKENRRSQILAEILPPSDHFLTTSINQFVDTEIIEKLITESLSESDKSIWDLPIRLFK